VSIDSILAESDREADRFAWEGTFATYLRMVTERPAMSRLSHALIDEAIQAPGVDTRPLGEPVYSLFEDEIFGLEDTLQRIVQYFASAAQRLEVRHRILLLLGPPASGKSSIVALIKGALEEYTRTDEGAVYAIHGCPMQEDPLHLVPSRLRGGLEEEYGVLVEGDLCPRCRYVLRTEYLGRVSEMPVRRFTFSEQEAIGIGYYVATNPNPTDASLLVGSVDSSRLEGDRLAVAGKAFRLDGEFNVANRGLIELVEMFKADRHLLTSLLGLAQEQVIKMERFGSIYADEAIIGHSNEGDFATFSEDQHSEALKDRIIAIQVPYNLRIRDEVNIYAKMLKRADIGGAHVAPLTLAAASVFAVLSRILPPSAQGMSVTDKLRLLDGQMVTGYSKQDVVEMRRHQPEDGMSGLSPRYVMNRLGAVAGDSELGCILPLAVLDSLWRGLGENVSLAADEQAKFLGIVQTSASEYSDLAVKDVQRAYEEEFETAATMLFDSYLRNIEEFVKRETEGEGRPQRGRDSSERDMREIERSIGVTERSKAEFRREMKGLNDAWKAKGLPFTYTTDGRLHAAIEAKLFPSRRQLTSALTQPRFARQRVEWARRRSVIGTRLVEKYEYCAICAEDVIEYVTQVLKSKPVLKTPKGEGIEWLWDLHPQPTGIVSDSREDEAEPEAAAS